MCGGLAAVAVCGLVVGCTLFSCGGPQAWQAAFFSHAGAKSSGSSIVVCFACFGVGTNVCSAGFMLPPGTLCHNALHVTAVGPTAWGVLGCSLLSSKLSPSGSAVVARACCRLWLGNSPDVYIAASVASSATGGKYQGSGIYKLRAPKMPL